MKIINVWINKFQSSKNKQSGHKHYDVKSSMFFWLNVFVLTSVSMIVYLFFTRSWLQSSEQNNRKLISLNWTVRMSDNLSERVQILGHTHIICITVREDRIISCEIFCDLRYKCFKSVLRTLTKFALFSNQKVRKYFHL
jgi:hypothetical protein